MARQNFKTFTLRVPEELIGKLRIKAGQVSAERGEYVSANALMLELLEKSASAALPTKADSEVMVSVDKSMADSLMHYVKEGLIARVNQHSDLQTAIGQLIVKAVKQGMSKKKSKGVKKAEPNLDKIRKAREKLLSTKSTRR